MNSAADSVHSDQAPIEAESGLPLFIEIEIETIGACNRKCWHCKWGRDRDLGPMGRMPWETIEKIVGELVDLDYEGALGWYSTNEPLLDKRILDIVRFTSERLPKTFLTLVTNGDLLTLKRTDELFAAGLNALCVSLYDDKKLGNLTRIQAETEHDIQFFDMRDLQMGGDRIFNRGGTLLNDPAPNPFLRQSCEFPRHSMAINWDGRQKLCCGDMYAEAFSEEYNVTHMTLLQLWHNPTLQHYRTTLRTQGRQGLKLCEACDFDSSRRWADTTTYATEETEPAR